MTECNMSYFTYPYQDIEKRKILIITDLGWNQAIWLSPETVEKDGKFLLYLVVRKDKCDLPVIILGAEMVAPCVCPFSLSRYYRIREAALKANLQHSKVKSIIWLVNKGVNCTLKPRKTFIRVQRSPLTARRISPSPVFYRPVTGLSAASLLDICKEILPQLPKDMAALGRFKLDLTVLSPFQHIGTHVENYTFDWKPSQLV